MGCCSGWEPSPLQKNKRLVPLSSPTSAVWGCAGSVSYATALPSILPTHTRMKEEMLSSPTTHMMHDRPSSSHSLIWKLHTDSHSPLFCIFKNYNSSPFSFTHIWSGLHFMIQPRLEKHIYSEHYLMCSCSLFFIIIHLALTGITTSCKYIV